MSDEKESKTINISPLPSCVDDTVKEALKPAAKGIGTLLGDLLSMATNGIHFKAEKARIQQEHDLEVFKAGLTKKLEEKPEDCLIEPHLQVVGQAMDSAKYCLNEEEIRKMFENLIVNAADKRYQSQVHPSFPTIIAQMSPLDAENLALLRSRDAYPIVSYRLITSEDGGYADGFKNFFLGNANMQSFQDFELQAASMTSLNRLGLTEISYSEHFSDDAVYEPFKHTLVMEEMQKIVRHQSMYKRVDFQRGLVRLTPMGKTFVRVCFTS